MASPVGDLFGAALQDRLAATAPLAARLRPATLDDMVGQEHLLGPGRPLRSLIEAERLAGAGHAGPSRLPKRASRNGRWLYSAALSSQSLDLEVLVRAAESRR